MLPLKMYHRYTGALGPPRLAFLGIDLWWKSSGFASDYGYISNRSQALSLVAAQVIDGHNAMK